MECWEMWGWGGEMELEMEGYILDGGTTRPVIQRSCCWWSQTEEQLRNLTGTAEEPNEEPQNVKESPPEPFPHLPELEIQPWILKL